MARPLRINVQGGMHHITAEGNEGRKIFTARRDYERFLADLERTVEQHRILLHAYVLMPNHFHLLVETPRGNLSAFMHDLNTSYTVYFNQQHKRVGHLFRGRYKSLLIERETYLLAASRYLHLNPVRAKLVNEPEDYPWSSYPAYMGLVTTPWLTTSEVLSTFGQGPSAVQRYGTYVEDGVSTPPPNPGKESRGQVVLGGEKFLEAARTAFLKVRKPSDIPQWKQLSARSRTASVGQVVTAVSDEMQVRSSTILKRRKKDNSAKKVAMFVARDHAGLSLNEIARAFDVHYTAVSKHVNEMRVKAKKDKPLYDLVQRIKARVDS